MSVYVIYVCGAGLGVDNEFQTNRWNPHCHLQKFSDDSAIVGLIRDGDDRAYRELIKDFLDRRQQNHL